MLEMAIVVMAAEVELAVPVQAMPDSGEFAWNRPSVAGLATGHATQLERTSAILCCSALPVLRETASHGAGQRRP